jgi:hypothetical protein
MVRPLRVMLGRASMAAATFSAGGLAATAKRGKPVARAAATAAGISGMSMGMVVLLPSRR